MRAYTNTSDVSLVHSALLTSHPTTNCRAIHGINVRVGWSRAETLTLSYTLAGDCTRLRIPDVRAQASVDGLWRHTCFEAFLCPKDGTAYWEFNFSPSSEWAMYQFRSYRDRVANGGTVAPPQIVIHRSAGRLELDARLRLPHFFTVQPLRAGLSAVIEDTHGTLSYWALKHPSEKPDFHHADTFALEIAPMMMATGKEPR